MGRVKLITLNIRTVMLLLITLTAIALALSPSLAQGSSTGIAEEQSMSPSALGVPIGPLTSDLQTSPQQMAPDIPATMKECREEKQAGRAVSCARNAFAVTTVLANGSYHIDWSGWAGRHTDVDYYTVQRLRFMYRYDFRLEGDGTPVMDTDYTIPDVSSCWPRPAAGRWAWTCNGISNVYEDPSGVPTSVEQLRDSGDSYTSEHWTGSLLAPGRKHDVPVRALRIPGDPDGPHADNPQSPSDRLTQQQVDDGSIDLTASDIEMHLYLITAHFENGSSQTSYKLVDGGAFADR